MLKGAAKLTPTAIKQDCHKPIIVQMMALIKGKLDQTAPIDVAFFTCLMTIFYSAVQVGEFTTQRLDSFNPTEHITHSGMCNNIDHNRLHTKVFTLLCTKVSSSGEEVHWMLQFFSHIILCCYSFTHIT